MRNRSFLSLLIILLLFLSCETTEQNQSVLNISSGKVERLENFPSKFVTPRNIDIWLPDGYNPDGNYPVLYMHDGQMLFDSTVTWNKQEWGVDEVMGSLINQGIIRETIVVGIWNIPNERGADYFPNKPIDNLSQHVKDTLINTSWYGNKLFPINIRSDQYLQFIVEELKPYVDEHYSTRPGPEDTFTAGSSMGGLISMYAICEYPDVFSGAACLSTHWPGALDSINNPVPIAFINYLQEHLPDQANHKFYFDYGTATLDSLYEKYQVKADSVMLSAGYTSRNWITRKFPGADHSENAWKERLQIPITFLLKE